MEIVRQQLISGSLGWLESRVAELSARGWKVVPGTITVCWFKYVDSSLNQEKYGRDYCLVMERPEPDVI